MVIHDRIQYRLDKSTQQGCNYSQPPRFMKNQSMMSAKNDTITEMLRKLHIVSGYTSASGCRIVFSQGSALVLFQHTDDTNKASPSPTHFRNYSIFDVSRKGCNATVRVRNEISGLNCSEPLISSKKAINGVFESTPLLAIEWARDVTNVP